MLDFQLCRQLLIEALTHLAAAEENPQCAQEPQTDMGPGNVPGSALLHRQIRGQRHSLADAAPDVALVIPLGGMACQASCPGNQRLHEAQIRPALIRLAGAHLGPALFESPQSGGFPGVRGVLRPHRLQAADVAVPARLMSLQFMHLPRHVIGVNQGQPPA